jgi:carbon starvation protein
LKAASDEITARRPGLDPLRTRGVKKVLSALVWLVVALLGAVGYVSLALKRNEPINSGFILLAAVCTYAIGYRFYSKWIAAKVLALDDRRATPCEVHEDGRDFVKTNKWIVFGHHFAAISGPGPLVGPVLAAQFGYLPGTIWILIGVVLGGAVQDFIILTASMRRDGRSLAQMVREELTKTVGAVGALAILTIMIILLAVLGLVVVMALAESPWGVFTVAATIPIAMLMGGYLRWFRIGKVLEVSIIGFFLLLLAVWGGNWVSHDETLKGWFLLSKPTLAWAVIIYGFAASVLPVWLLLAPRDYLSTFLKLGTIVALALGTFIILPELNMPGFTDFARNGNGPVVPGSVFPFCFITIACGAISGFHTLIASGITPKIITRESHARPIGYGAMCLESLVAIMALIAACTLQPGVYLSMNIVGDPAATIEKVNAYGPTYAVTMEQMNGLAKQVGEETLFGRTGGAPTLAVGMAQLFARIPIFGEGTLSFFYHFALMFEALFILTTLDAGTRVGRYLLQDVLGKFIPPLRNTSSISAGIFASALIVLGWGFFLYKGAVDPEGGTKALWPIFGIANQLLASIALCLATTILIKRQIQRGGKLVYALVTLVPLVWLLSVTCTAAVQKVWGDTKIGGFLAVAEMVSTKTLPEKEAALAKAQATGDTAAIAKAEVALKNERTRLFNNRVDAWVTGFFLVMVVVIVSLSIRHWLRLISGKVEPRLSETEPVWLPASEVAGAPPLGAMGAVTIGLTMLKEVSGQGAMEREAVLIAEAEAKACECETPAPAKGRRNVYLSVTDRQFRSPNRCC